jgi:hypothetical protein
LGKKTVHCQKFLPCGCRSRKRAISRKTPMEAPRDEQRPADFVKVRHLANMEMCHKRLVARHPESSQENSPGRLPIGQQVASRLPTCPTIWALTWAEACQVLRPSH